MDDNLPGLQSQPDNDHIPNSLKAYLGALDTLPLELLGEILRQPDLRTFMDFRHVNRRAMWLVESFPQCKAIGNMHTMRSVELSISRPAGGSPAKHSKKNYAQPNAKSAAILVTTSTFLRANEYVSFVFRRIHDIYHCGTVMRLASLGLTV
ncbi:hypothetical protein H2248_003149 [Termitomyces sp. 'cryptogamus']|nr:hypothetical protein H2248_003149 [Termitomyces sp. 'cryptogamus']